MILRLIGIFLKFFDATEKNKWLMRLYMLFLPITLLLDTFCFLWCWRVVIVPALLTQENVVKFFDENEFGYKWWKLYKKDMIEPDSFLDTIKFDELKVQVEREFTTSILKIIRENTSTDIEEYVSLICVTSIDPDSKFRIYNVSMQYYRWYVVRMNWLKSLPIWLVTAGSLWLAANWAIRFLALHHFTFSV
jgi:hypothetical protein